MKRFSSQAHFAGLGLALILLAAVAIVSYVSWERYVLASDATRHTRALMAQLRGLLTDLQDAENGQRGYLLTGDREYLAPYEQALPKIEPDLGAIDKLREADAEETALAQQLESLTKKKVAELRATVDLERRGESAAAMAIVRTNEGINAMRAIRGLEQRLDDREEELLEIARTRARQLARLSELTSVLGSAATFVIILAATVQIHSLLRTRERLNGETSRLAADFRHLADSVPQMVWRMTDEGKLEYVNRRWLEFTGVGSDTAEVDRWQELLHPGDREAFVARWRESLETKAALMAECRLRDRSTGRYRWFLFRATPVRDEPFARLRWYSTFTDIDQQKATALTLQRTNEDLQQFVFSASHDLQEPLRILMLYSQRIRSRSSENLNDELVRDLGFVSEAAERMSSLVSDLLTYTQVTNSETEAEQTCDATLALRNTLEILGSAIRATDANVTYGELPKVHIPEIQLQEIFKNLIGNALKYRMAGLVPRITIEAKADGSEWVFSVGDNGIGIDPVFHERIFGIFKRLHTTSQYPGTGLGLAICKKIVERHHGRIWVESNLGRGSTFFFSLPTNSTS